MPALPSWLTNPLWDQFAALLPVRSTVDPTHPLGGHRRRISDRTVFDKLLQVLRFGFSYQAIADVTCSATTIRNRRNEWITLGIFVRLKQIALDAYDRIVGPLLENLAVDGSIAKVPPAVASAPAGPVDRGKQGLKRSTVVEDHGIPLGRARREPARLALLAPTLDALTDLGPLPEDVGPASRAG